MNTSQKPSLILSIDDEVSLCLANAALLRADADKAAVQAEETHARAKSFAKVKKTAVALEGYEIAMDFVLAAIRCEELAFEFEQQAAVWLDQKAELESKTLGTA